MHAGIDETNVYGRLDFKGKISSTPFELGVNLESWEERGQSPRQALRLEVAVEGGKIRRWHVAAPENPVPLESSDRLGEGAARVALLRNFEFRVPLAWLSAAPASSEPARAAKPPVANRIRMRLSLWQNRLPVDALPLEGWIELHLLDEGELMSLY